MMIRLYDVSVPTLVRGLASLKGLLDKGAAHASLRKFDPVGLLQARLAPDMFPFQRQVQVVCDGAKGAVARLAGIENPRHEDHETTFEELRARVDKTLNFVGGVTEAQFEGAETREIVLTFPTQTLKFTGVDYWTHFALPNFYFHLTTAYDLLRANGVELGKRDFLGQIQ
jgi:hypothetical protein